MIRPNYLFPLLLCTVVAAAAVENSTETRHPTNLERSPAPLLLEADVAVELHYPTFTWRATADGNLAVRESSLAKEEITEPYNLTLGEQVFDPLIDGQPVPAGWGAVAHDGPDLYLVQAWGPGQEGWIDDLRAAGVEPLQYIHPFTWVVWTRPGALASCTTLAWVRWIGPFLPAYRVLPRWRELAADEVVATDVLLCSLADLGELKRRLQALSLEPVPVRSVDHRLAVATVRLRGDQLRDAAALPGVYSVQPQPTDGGLRGEMNDQVDAGNLDGDGFAVPGYLDWLVQHGYSGTLVTMANVDSGLDQDHSDLISRVVDCIGVTCAGITSSTHGTHTAGLMAGDGSSGVVDSCGFLRGLGVAPGAWLVEQSYYPHYLETDGMLLLIRESHANGAALSSNAWGPSGSPLGYDNDTMQVDLGVRDADPESAGNQAFTYVLSVMNGHGGTSTQGTPDEAKNVISVGATEMQDSAGAQSLEINNLAGVSAHGPALDGRTLPHLVAPGCRVDSTIHGGGHGLSCGTSMASPQVSGAAALFIERYRWLSGGQEPSPALVKAALLAVAHDLAGHLDADGNAMGHPFDSKQGWGRLNLSEVIDPTLPVVYEDAPRVFESSGEQWVKTATPVDTNRAMRLMLVWTDAAGHGLGGSTPAWNNDLDLIVEADDILYYGNNFGPDGWSQSGGWADVRNNTEGIFLGPLPPAQITLRVRAVNVASDGIPGQGDDSDQDFALVVSNAVLEDCVPAPTFTSLPTLDEVEQQGAQGFFLQWQSAASCGGQVSAAVYLRDPEIPPRQVLVAETPDLSITLFGGVPGQEYCFQVMLVEDGTEGQTSSNICLVGSAARAAGDVDCDGDVNADDMAPLVEHLFGAPPPECAGYPAADVDLDSAVDAADLAALQTYATDPL